MKKLLFLLVALLCISFGKAQVPILRHPANKDTVPTVIKLDTAAHPANKGIEGEFREKKPYNIGDHVHGGIVFYIDESGQHGLVAATEDQSEGTPWSNGNLNVANPVRNDGIGIGRNNTDFIIATLGRHDYAANICAIYVGGGFADWYLPSKYELNLLYIRRSRVGGFASVNYWSSSEANYGEGFASSQNFDNGNQRLDPKAFKYRVRAIRAF
jgi:hypothetical protein